MSGFRNFHVCQEWHFLKRKILVNLSYNQRMPLFSLLLSWWVCNWYFLRWLLYYTNTNISVAGAESLHNYTKVRLLIILLYYYLNKRPECSFFCGRLLWWRLHSLDDQQVSLLCLTTKRVQFNLSSVYPTTYLYSHTQWWKNNSDHLTLLYSMTSERLKVQYVLEVRTAEVLIIVLI